MAERLQLTDQDGDAITAEDFGGWLIVDIADRHGDASCAVSLDAQQVRQLVDHLTRWLHP